MPSSKTVFLKQGVATHLCGNIILQCVSNSKNIIWFIKMIHINQVFSNDHQKRFFYIISILVFLDFRSLDKFSSHKYDHEIESLKRLFVIKVVSTKFFQENKSLNRLRNSFNLLKKLVDKFKLKIKSFGLINRFKFSDSYQFIDLNSFDFMIVLVANKFFRRSKV